ncbi:MAG: SRPBCC family protein [Candidatus Marinamargulisbacteria bacterium]
MSKFKSVFIVISFCTFSLIFGVLFAYYMGSTLPERVTMAQSKSFDANQDLIWAALLDIENYPLWKPNLQSIEMLGTNESGYTKWRENYSLGKSISYEITEYIPKSLIEVKITSSKNSPEGIWLYKLSNYQDRGVLQIKRFAIVESEIDRFINRWIDTKYNEVDYQLISFNTYLSQLLEDQDEIQSLLTPDSIENNESPIN